MDFKTQTIETHFKGLNICYLYNNFIIIKKIAIYCILPSIAKNDFILPLLPATWQTIAAESLKWPVDDDHHDIKLSSKKKNNKKQEIESEDEYILNEDDDEQESEITEEEEEDSLE
jgi:hypothetical protein